VDIRRDVISCFVIRSLSGDWYASVDLNGITVLPVDRRSL